MAREELFINEIEQKKIKRVGGRNIGSTMRLKAAAETLKENRMDQIRKEMKEQREAKASRIDNPDDENDKIKKPKTNEIDMQAIKAKASSKNQNNTSCNLLLTHMSD